MISAIALDDEPLSLKVIKAFCDKTDFIDLKQTFTETGKAIKFLDTNSIDLIFLDIKMPAMSGIEFYKKFSPDTMVIFTTAYSDYAVEGFSLNAIDYLLKPFEYERFLQAAEKAREFNDYRKFKSQTSSEYLFVKSDYSVVKISLDSINFIEGFDNYVKIHLDNKKFVLTRMSMKLMMEKLNPKEFMRVHRSFVVALKKIDSFRNKTLYIGDKEIPVGTNYLNTISGLFK